MISAGAVVSIGTDGAASNNDLDMIGEISTVAKFHKGLSLNPTVLPAEEVIKLATINGANCLYMKNTGELKSGYDADFTIFTFDTPFTTPLYNPLSQIVYSAKPENVCDLFVNGKAVMLNKKITTFDEYEILEKARWWGEKIRNGQIKNKGASNSIL